MAMIPCPECGRQISDRAPACPNCGCPCQDTSALPGPSTQNRAQTDSPGPPFAIPSDLGVAPPVAHDRLLSEDFLALRPHGNTYIYFDASGAPVGHVRIEKKSDCVELFSSDHAHAKVLSVLNKNPARLFMLWRPKRISWELRDCVRPELLGVIQVHRSFLGRFRSRLLDRNGKVIGTVHGNSGLASALASLLYVLWPLVCLVLLPLLSVGELPFLWPLRYILIVLAALGTGLQAWLVGRAGVAMSLAGYKVAVITTKGKTTELRLIPHATDHRARFLALAIPILMARGLRELGG